MSTVKFKYSSMKNINFRGIIDSKIDREDWNAMSYNERDQIEHELLDQLVDLVEVEE